MLELPEARTLAAQCNETIANKKIMYAIANASPHGFAFYSGNPDDYSALLTGRTIKNAQGFGGRTEIALDGAYLEFGDGVNARYLTATEKVPKKHQLLLEFEDGDKLVCTIQMYGIISAHTKPQDNFYANVSRERPSPLTEAFNEAYFDALWRESKQNLSSKAFLATEQRIPGLGNGVLQDILFNARIHPKTKLEKLDDGDKNAMYKSTKETLMQMTLGGGRDTEKDLFGCPGGYKTILSRLTAGKPCPVCGGEIIREAYLGGNIYYCPTCQKHIK